MLSDQLRISYDDDDGWVTFHKKSPCGNPDTDGFPLRSGFTMDDIREALLSTAWVEQHGDRLLADSSVNCESMCATVEAMLLYFDRPGEPGRRLVQIQEAVERYSVFDANLDIPLWAYAWLDLAVREELADEVRSTDDIWGGGQLIVDLTGHCQCHIEQLVARYALSKGSAGTGKMAPSSRGRRRTEPGDQDAKTG